RASGMPERYIVREAADCAFEVFDTEESKRVYPFDSLPLDRPLTRDAAETIAAYDNGGGCPDCPAEPLKARRSRCPICREWISYTPQHGRHKYPTYERGRIVWRASAFNSADVAFLGHMNANTDTHT